MMMIANRHDDADMQASLQMVDTSGTLGQSTCSFGAPVILDLPVIPPRAYWPRFGPDGGHSFEVYKHSELKARMRQRK